MTGISAEYSEIPSAWELNHNYERLEGAGNKSVWRSGEVVIKKTNRFTIWEANKLFFAISEDKSFNISLPRLFLTRSCRPEMQVGKDIWWAETFLPGSHPSTDSPEDYKIIGQIARSFHDGINCNSQIQSILPKESYTTDLITTLNNDSVPLFNKSLFLIEVCNFLKLAAPWLNDLPRKIIHGDLSMGNIIFDANINGGLIDFDFLSHDPIEFDLAVCLTTILLRSHMDGKNKNIALRELLNGYGNISQKQLFITVLARRFLALSSNLKHPEPSKVIIKRQMLHIHTIFRIIKENFQI